MGICRWVLLGPAKLPDPLTQQLSVPRLAKAVEGTEATLFELQHNSTQLNSNPFKLPGLP